MKVQIMIQDAESQEEVGYLQVRGRIMNEEQEINFARRIMDRLHLPGCSLALYIKPETENE